MLHFPCVSLSNLSKMLDEKYDIRNKMIVRSFSDPDLLALENEIIRINKLITSQRRHCRRCNACSVIGGKRLSAVVKDTGTPGSVVSSWPHDGFLYLA
jgi:hypothetical protein